MLEHYEKQTEDEAVAEDEAAFRLRGHTVVLIPKGLVPEVTRLIETRRSRRQSSSGGPKTVSKPMEDKPRQGRASGR